ncbi:MAG TPA: PKD domain-containing protein, partial [Verrucomicrobiae bacterium]|nr:PKD domain-containing protein [Verrucomicrobiae bacterium]
DTINNRPTSWTIDDNDYRSLAQPNALWNWSGGGGEMGITALRSLGYETHGITNDPAFLSLAYGSGTSSWQNNYRIGTNSPCAGAGANLGSLNLPGLNLDQDGIARPSTGPWDIGACEYNTNSVAPSAPVASFIASPASGTVPLPVTFVDTSSGTITNRFWDFGDGTSTNTSATTVVYQYNAPGTNTVQLIAAGPGGSGSSIRTNLITVNSAVSTNSIPPPVASFDATPTNGIAPLTVTFLDTSTGTITNRLWHFGDGTSTNTVAAAVVHQYAASGTNSVRLSVYGPGGANGLVKPDLIFVAPADSTNSVPPPVASFGAAPTSGTAPLLVTFTDTSTGTINSRSWQFGDGTVTNTTATTMIYQYNTPGIDTVQLVVNGPGGSSTNVQPNLIAVGSGSDDTNNVPIPVASFSAAPTSGTAPLVVTFADASTGTIANRFWDFGDGSSMNTSGGSVVHEYTTPGTDSVQLVVSGPGGTAVSTQNNLIIVKSDSESNGGTNGVAQFGDHNRWRFLTTY